MEKIEVGGLRILEELEQIPFTSAIEASDLFLDRRSFKGRCGYRAAMATAPGVGGDEPQGLWRHRGSPTSRRMIAALGGKVFISDSANPEPTSETASDMTMSSLGTPFASTAKLSGAQLHKHFYLGTDEENVAMRRVKFTGPDTYALESLESIAQPAAPLATKEALSWYKYRANVGGGAGQCAVAGTNCAFSTTVSGLLSDWYGIVGTTGDSSQPSDGAIAKVTLNTAVNIKGADWIVFGVSPPDDSASLKAVDIEISHNDTDYVKIGTITDRQPIPDSPNTIFCYIGGVKDTFKETFKYIKFTVTQNGGASTLRYALLGHLILPGRRPVQPLHYQITAWNPSTLQESPLSPEAVTSTGEQVIITNDDVKGSPITYTDQKMGNDAYHSTTAILNPFDPSNVRIFNKYAGLSIPALEEIGVPVVVSGNMPSGYSGNLTARLWLQTETGLREVITQATLAAGAAYSLRDYGGTSVLYGKLYKAGGTPPRMTGMCALDGRLVSIYENEVSISSFVPLDTATTNPYPQWPMVATEPADGWKFTLDGGGSREQGQCCVAGDRVYLLTNERAMYLSGLFPNAPHYECAPQGVVSRRGAIWARSSLIWASVDGIYMYVPSLHNTTLGGNRAIELSQEIRDYYWRTFQPNSTTVVEYQQGSLYCFTGTRYIRYHFDTKTWTTGTLTDSPLHTCRWYDVGSTTQVGMQMWMFLSDASTHSRVIVRWQPDYTVGVSNAASTDAGTAIADWNYSTGFLDLPGNGILKWLYCVSDGAVMCFCEKTPTDKEWFSVRGIVAGHNERAMPPNPKAHALRIRFKGSNATSVKRLGYLVEPVEAKGASDTS